ncbi:MAG: exonuclease domain-containing protein [Oscillospiraceae bacterium]|nr:exonuclease domain-containing protein [Oscillospiraceae bacterium]
MSTRAVLLDENYKAVDEFVTFVSPEYGMVDKFIEELTGIKNSDLMGAPVFEDAVRSFANWLPEDSVLVTWSESDRAQIENETAAKNLSIPEMEKFSERWVDCQKTFGEKMKNKKCYKLSEALAIADIESDIGEHDALIDAKNTALLFKKMEREEALRLNPYFSTEENIKTAVYTPFAALLALI